MKKHEIKPLIGYKCFSGSTDEVKSPKSKFKKALRTISHSDVWRTIKDTIDACFSIFCSFAGATVLFWCLSLLAKFTDYLI